MPRAHLGAKPRLPAKRPRIRPTATLGALARDQPRGKVWAAPRPEDLQGGRYAAWRGVLCSQAAGMFGRMSLCPSSSIAMSTRGARSIVRPTTFPVR
jgi:hypothetical protein